MDNKVKFDDGRLLDLAWMQYRMGLNPKKPAMVPVKGTVLTNGQRNELIAYLGISVSSRPMSVGSMKRRIFEIIKYEGQTSQYNSSQPVNRAELQAILNWIEEKAAK
jgi:hypothetical protein